MSYCVESTEVTEMDYGNYTEDEPVEEEAIIEGDSCLVKAQQALDDGISPACYWCSEMCARGAALVREIENRQFRVSMKRHARV
jgi:hypothetical protein